MSDCPDCAEAREVLGKCYSAAMALIDRIQETGQLTKKLADEYYALRERVQFLERVERLGRAPSDS